MLLMPLAFRSQVTVEDVESGFAKALLPKVTLCVLLNVSELMMRDLQRPTGSSFGSAIEANVQSQAALSADIWLQVPFWIQLAWDILGTVWD